MASNDSLYGCTSTFPPSFDTEPPPIDDAESPIDTKPADGATSFGDWCDFSGFSSNNNYQDDSFGSNLTFSAHLDTVPPPLDIDEINDNQQDSNDNKDQLSKASSLDVSPIESSADEFGSFDNLKRPVYNEGETNAKIQIDDFDKNDEEGISNEIPDSFDMFESATDDEIKQELNAATDFGAFDTGEPFLLVEKPGESISPVSSDFGSNDESGSTAMKMKFEVVRSPSEELGDIESSDMKFDDNMPSEDFGEFDKMEISTIDIKDENNDFGNFNQENISDINFQTDDFGGFDNAKMSPEGNEEMINSTSDTPDLFSDDKETLNAKEIDSSDNDFGMFNEVESSGIKSQEISVENFGAFDNDENLSSTTNKLNDASNDFDTFNQADTEDTNIREGDDFGAFDSEDNSSLAAKKDKNDFGMFNEAETSDSDSKDSSHIPSNDFGAFNDESTSQETFGMFEEVKASDRNIDNPNSLPPSDDFGTFSNNDLAEVATDDFGAFNEIQADTKNVDGDDFGNFSNFEGPNEDVVKVDSSNEFSAFGDFDSAANLSVKTTDFGGFNENCEVGGSDDFGEFGESKVDSSSGFGDFGGVKKSTEVSNDTFGNFDNFEKATESDDGFAQFNSFESETNSPAVKDQIDSVNISGNQFTNQDNESVKCFNALNHCSSDKDDAVPMKGTEKKVYDIIGHLSSYLKTDEDVTLWQELNMSEDDSKYSLSYQNSNSFRSQIFSFNLDFKQINLSSEMGSSILVPEQASNTPSKNTLLAQSLSKSLNSEKDFAALKGKDCSSGTPSETTSLDLEFFISNSQTSLPNSDSASSINLKEIKNLDMKHIEPQLVDLNISSSSTDINPVQNPSSSNQFTEIMSPSVNELSDQSMDGTLQGDSTLTGAFEWGETVGDAPFANNAMNDMNDFGNFASTADDHFDTSSITSSQSNTDSIATSLNNAEIASPPSKLVNISSDADDSFSSFFTSGTAAPAPTDTSNNAYGAFSNDLFGLKMDDSPKNTISTLPDTSGPVIDVPSSLTSDFSSIDSTSNTPVLPMDDFSAFSMKPNSVQEADEFACFESDTGTGTSSNLASDDFGNFMSKVESGSKDAPIDDFSSFPSISGKENDFTGFTSNAIVDNVPPDDFASFTSNTESNISDLPVNDFASFSSGTETNISDKVSDDFACFTTNTLSDPRNQNEITTANVVADDFAAFTSNTISNASDTINLESSVAGSGLAEVIPFSSPSTSLNDDFSGFSSNKSISIAADAENDLSKLSSDDFASFSSTVEFSTSSSATNDFALFTSNSETNIPSLSTDDFAAFSSNTKINADKPVDDFDCFTSVTEKNISNQTLDDFADLTSNASEPISNTAIDNFTNFSSVVTENVSTKPIDDFAAFSTVTDKPKESIDDFACFTSSTVPENTSNDFSSFSFNTNISTADKPLDDFSSLSSINSTSLPFDDFSSVNSGDLCKNAVSQVHDDFANFTETVQPATTSDEFADFASAPETFPTITTIKHSNFPSLDSPKISDKSIDKFAAFTAFSYESNTSTSNTEIIPSFDSNSEKDSSKGAVDDFACFESVAASAPSNPPFDSFASFSLKPESTEPVDKYACFSALSGDNAAPDQSNEESGNFMKLSSDFSTFTTNTSTQQSNDFADFSQPALPSEVENNNTTITHVLECTDQNLTSDSFGDFADVETDIPFPTSLSLAPKDAGQTLNADLFPVSSSILSTGKIDSKTNIMGTGNNNFAPSFESNTKNVLSKTASEDDVFSDFAESPRAPNFRVYSQLSGTSIDVDSCSSVSDFQFGNENETDFANFSDKKCDTDFADFQNFSTSVSGTSLPSSLSDVNLNMTNTSSSTLLSGSDTSLDPSKSTTNITSTSFDSMFKSPAPFADDLFKSSAVPVKPESLFLNNTPAPSTSVSGGFESNTPALPENVNLSGGFADFSSFQSTDNTGFSSFQSTDQSLSQQPSFNEQFSNMNLTDSSSNMLQGMVPPNVQHQHQPVAPTSSSKDLESLSLNQIHPNMPAGLGGMNVMYPQNNMNSQQQAFPNQQFNMQGYPNAQNQIASMQVHPNFSNTPQQVGFPANYSNTGQQGPGFPHVGPQGMVRGNPRQPQRFGYPQQYPHNMAPPYRQQFTQRPEQKRSRFQTQGGKDPFASFTIRSNAEKLDINLANRTLVSGVEKPKLNQIPTKSNPK